MCAEPLHEAWATFDPMLAHVIQLIHCRLFTRFPICLVKLIEILFDFLHIHIHVKHGIVTHLVCNIMRTSISNTFTLRLKNLQFGQRNFLTYLVSCCVSIHVVGIWEIHAWEVGNLFTHEWLCDTPLHPCLVLHYRSIFLILFLDYTSIWTSQVLQPYFPKVKH
jgi:hypothetical protein